MGELQFPMYELIGPEAKVGLAASKWMSSAPGLTVVRGPGRMRRRQGQARDRHRRDDADDAVLKREVQPHDEGAVEEGGEVRGEGGGEVDVGRHQQAREHVDRAGRGHVGQRVARASGFGDGRADDEWVETGGEHLVERIGQMGAEGHLGTVDQPEGGGVGDPACRSTRSCTRTARGRGQGRERDGRTGELWNHAPSDTSREKETRRLSATPWGLRFESEGFSGRSKTERMQRRGRPPTLGDSPRCPVPTQTAVDSTALGRQHALTFDPITGPRGPSAPGAREVSLTSPSLRRAVVAYAEVTKGGGR